MKRIEYVLPVAAMRGKLSAKGEGLQYAENNNPAFEAPDGRQYARNYEGAFIAAKRSSDGKKYFSVKTKSATLIDNASKRRMALLGAAGACVAYILKPGNMSVVNVLGPLNAHYEHAKSTEGFKGSLRKYVFLTVYAALEAGKDFEWPAIQLAPQTTIPAVKLYSRWSGSDIDGQQERVVNVSDAILVKFWLQLAKNGITFKIKYSPDTDGGFDPENYVTLTGVAHDGDTFGQLIESSNNILGLEKDEQNNIQMSNGRGVFKADGDGVTTATEIDSTEGYYAESAG